MLLQVYYILIPNTQCNNPSYSLKNSLLWVMMTAVQDVAHRKASRLSERSGAGGWGGGAGRWEKGHSQGRYRATDQGEWWALINTRELVAFWCSKHLSEGRREGNGKCCWGCLWEGDGHMGKEYWEGISHCRSIVWKFSVQKCFPLSPRHLRQCGN